MVSKTAIKMLSAICLNRLPFLVKFKALSILFNTSSDGVLFFRFSKVSFLNTNPSILSNHIQLLSISLLIDIGISGLFLFFIKNASISFLTGSDFLVPRLPMRMNDVELITAFLIGTGSSLPGVELVS